MSFFEWARTDDLICAANQRTRARLTAVIDRLLSSQMGAVYRRAEPMLRSLAETSLASQPRIHVWCATAKLLLAAEESGADPDPVQTGHLHLDGLSPERLFELHVLQAAEALASTLSTVGGTLAVDIPITPGMRFVAGRLGTFTLNEDAPFTMEVSREALLLTGAVREGAAIPPPVVSGIEIPIHDDVLCSPWLSTGPVIRSARALLPFVSALDQALQRLDAWDPTLKRGCTSLVSAALAVHNSGESFSSSTNEASLGLVHLPGVTDVDDLADCLVHEAMHTKLYHLEALKPLFTPDSPTEERYYSPWREDPRPLRMLMHGAYVFTAVAEYWAFRHRASHHSTAAFSAQRRSAQVLQAVATLQCHGRFTQIGKRLLDAIAEHATATQTQSTLNERLQTAFERELSEHRLRHAHYVC